MSAAGTTAGGVSWGRLALARIGLAALGIAAGVGIGCVYVVIWHWFWVIIFAHFHVWSGSLAYLLDGILIIVLLWEGYRYKARMPPPPVFMSPAQALATPVSDYYLATTRHAAFTASELLYIAPRFFWWGVRQLRWLAWPGKEFDPVVQRVHLLLKSAPRPFALAEVHAVVGSREDAGKALPSWSRPGLLSGAAAMAR